MLKSRIIILLSCFTGSCLLVLGLNSLSKLSLPGHSGFIRKLPAHQITGTGFVRLSGKSWYFAGGDTSVIYLGNWSLPNKLLKVSLNHKDTSISRIWSINKLSFYKGAYLRTEREKVYLIDGIKPAITRGILADHQLTTDLRCPNFTAAVPLTSTSFILRTINKDRENVLVKVGGPGSSYTLVNQANTIFSTDGMLLKSPDGSKLIYSFYYRNQFLCLDTNLNVLYKGKTIDTVAHAKIKTGTINSLHETTITGPPPFVNEQCAANSQYLFIHSALKADNEESELMKEANPIDIYSLKDGHYIKSIYVISFAKEKLRDFRVYGHILIALYDHYLYFHQLNF